MFPQTKVEGHRGLWWACGGVKISKDREPKVDIYGVESQSCNELIT